MTYINDRNDQIAREYNFTVIDHPRGRQHAHSSYVKGRITVWQAYLPGKGVHWRSSIMRDGRHTAHETHMALEDALQRTEAMVKVKVSG